MNEKIRKNWERGPSKNLGGHGPPRAPLKSPLVALKKFGNQWCKSATRDLCSKQRHDNRQRKLYKIHCSVFPEKLVHIWWIMRFFLLFDLFVMAFLVNSDAHFLNHSLHWPVIVFFLLARFFDLKNLCYVLLGLWNFFTFLASTEKSGWKKSG